MTPWFLASIFLTVISWIAWLALRLNSDVLGEKVPIHWNINFEIDDWASADAAVNWLLLLPASMTLMLGFTWLFNRKKGLEPSTRSRFDLTMFLVMAFVLCVSGLTVLAMRTGEFPVRLFMALFFVFLGAIGFAMRGIPRNPWVGVRTPWTLKDDEIWTQTHDFTARLWPAIAVVGLVMLLIGMHPIWCLLMVVPMGLAPLIASYVFARRKRLQMGQPQ